MPKVVVKKQSSISAEDSFDKVCKMLENDKELKKLDPKYSCDFDKSSLSGSAKGSQFKADLKVSESGSGSTVEIVVDLPFHLALAKGIVEKTLTKKVEEAVG